MRVLPLLTSFLLSAPYAQAGPYIKIKNKVKGVDRNFNSLSNTARIGIEWEINSFTPYIEAGGGIKNYSDGQNDEHLAIEGGSKLELTDNLDLEAKVEALQYTDSFTWEIELETKYQF